jgi:hypothetical protein
MPIRFQHLSRHCLSQILFLLSNEYKSILLTKQRTFNGKEIEMTLGWFTGRLKDINYFTHAGGGGGYYCEMRIYPQKKYDHSYYV